MATTNKGIYYPSDYSNVADVPEDMKKLAESVDTQISNLDTNKVDKVNGKGLSTNDYTNEDKAKLDSLENYDDTEIKQDIEDIQAKDEAQDTELDKQSDLIQKLKDNCINVTTEEVTSLQVQDASTLPAKLDVRGNQRQEAREGYNVLQNKLTSNTINGVTFTINEDKSVTLNGTATNSIITNLITGKYDDNNATNPLIIPENITNYRLSGCPSGGSWSTYKLDIYAEDNELIATDLGEGANIQKESDTILNLLRVRIIVYAGAVLNNVTFYPMIIYGAENKPYEQYGASPSLDYPSPVRAVGDNVNMFNVWESGTISNSGNIESSDIAIRTADFISVKSNTSYTYKIYDETISNIALFEYDENSNFIKVMYNLNTEQTIVTSETTRKVKMRIVSTDLSTKMKFEEGEEATSYSPYGQGSVEVKKINKNYYDVGKSINDYFVTAGSKGATITQYNASNYVECDIIEGIMNIETYNTSGWNWIAKWLKINKNTNYTISLNKSTTSLTVLGFNSVETGITGDVIAELGSTNSKTTFNSGNYEYYAVSFYPPAGLEIAIQVEAGDLNTNFEEHQEQSYILDIQKPMLLGDYFVKEADGWKEVHTFNKKTFDGTETISTTNNGNSFSYIASDILATMNTTEIPKMYSNCYTVSTWTNRNDNNKANTIGIYGITIGFDKGSLTTADEFKQLLTQKNTEGNPVYVYYPLATPSKLACTEAQSKVLDQLNELDLFKGTNNIITAESLALMQMQYIADTETYIDNRIDEKLANINQQLLEIVGGN